MQSDAGPPTGNVPPAEGPAPVPESPEQSPRSAEVQTDDTVVCAEFERVLVDVARRLANVVDGQFDEVVTGCLRSLVEFLGFERSTLTAFFEEGTRFQATHSWAVAGVPIIPRDVHLHAQTPWFAHQIRSGHLVTISSAVDLPAVATGERDYLLRNGMRSILAIPLLTEGSIVGSLSFASFHSQKAWSPGLLSHLRLAAEILALGNRRYQYAEGLRAIGETMNHLSLDQPAPGRTATERSRDRARRLMQAESQERRRMGQVLHEDVMQVLSAVAMFVQSGKNGMPQTAASNQALASLKEALNTLRHLMLELRPEAFFERSLADGIRWLADQMRRRYDLDVELRIADTTDPVSADIRSLLYDCARKLLENVATHASCHRATLEIRPSGPHSIQLTVKDEGVGFDPASLRDLPGTAFGLSNTREHLDLFGGTLTIDSSPGQGTSVVVTVPRTE